MSLEVTRINKRFGGLKVLEDVSFTADRAEILGIIGPNGAGKTTLFNVITGYVPPDGGAVSLDGVNVLGRTPHQIARMGLVRTFQVCKPFAGLTVRENVMVAALARGESVEQAQTEAEEHLRLLELTRWIDQPARSLTLPGRKRLEMARALATRPRFLLLDEVMGGLRPPEVKEFIGLIRTVHAQGVGLVIIEHIMSAIMELCDRILVLNQGRPIATGTPAEIARNPAVIQAYLGEEYRHA